MYNYLAMAKKFVTINQNNKYYRLYLADLKGAIKKS